MLTARRFLLASSARAATPARLRGNLQQSAPLASKLLGLVVALEDRVGWRREFCSASSGPGDEARTARIAARRARAEAMAAKQAQLDSLLRSHESTRELVEAPCAEKQAEERRRADEAERRRGEERDRLLAEAGSIVKSLYRTCLRSVRVLRPGNEHDEADFREREEKELRELEEGFADGGEFSCTPPVDRENELCSRADYYTQWVREGFGQDIDCLAADLWREDDVERYVYLVRSGEDRRKYILKDYRFEDKYSDSFDQKRLDEFEERASRLVRDEYAARGWILKSDRENNLEDIQESDDIFADDVDFPVK